MRPGIVALLCTALFVQPGLAEEVRVHADVWGDNWFAVYLNGEPVVDDSVPFATERSFNANSDEFIAELPAVVTVVARDYLEDDSGLEYIGTRRQQMGDGGFIAQFLDADSGELLDASGAHWRCLSIHRAPLNRDCERSADPASACRAEISPEPDGWHDAEFDDSSWPAATEHTAAAVRPRRGYDEIDWHPAARLIWAPDLEIDNTILCRTTLSAPD